jgi:hypothetical protein
MLVKAGRLTTTALLAIWPVTAQTGQPSTASELKSTVLASGLEGSIGSAIGPDGALYVPEGGAGRIARIDIQSGAISTFASGLPTSSISPAFGATDIAFLGETAYVLVTLVGPESGGNDVDGIYRVDGPTTFTVVANIGRWSIAHPPATNFDIPPGVQYALQAHRGDLLVTDGHHNRVLRVKVGGCTPVPPDDSNISQLIAFDNVVPTGLDISGDRIYLAEAGPTPHLPKNGKVVEFGFHSAEVTQVASGARLAVDVESGPYHHLYVLSQGYWKGANPGEPAEPNTGALLRVDEDGKLTVLLDHLDRPTSLEFVGQTAFITSLSGEVWKVENVACRRHGH